MKRILGLLLIIRALAPVLAILIILWGAGQIMADLHAALDPPIQALQTEFDTVNTTIETAQEQFDTAKTEVTTLITRLRAFRIPRLLPNLPLNLTFPSITIPDLSFNRPDSVSVKWSTASFQVPTNCGGGVLNDLCGVLGDAVKFVTKTFAYPSDITIKTVPITITLPDVPAFNIPIPPIFNTIASGLRGLFSGFDGLFAIFRNAFDSFNTLGDHLQPIPGQVATITQEAQTLLSGLTTVVNNSGGLLLLMFGLIIVVVVIASVMTSFEHLQRGLRLLFGT
ncbi:MAG: hypothetical protein R3E39_29415 [Anaerolineae bacterium]